MQADVRYSLELEKVTLSLERAKKTNRCLVCALTSVTEKEGVTSVVFELGRYLATRRGKTVVVFDCTGRNALKGLLEVRSNIVDNTAGLHYTAIERLYFFEPAGSQEEAEGGVSTGRPEALCEKADYLLVDAPHAFEQSFLETAAAVDGVLLLLDPGVTGRAEAKTAVELMKQAGVSVIGVILNRRLRA